MPGWPSNEPSEVLAIRAQCDGTMDQALSVLYQRHVNQTKRIVRQRVRNHHEAEDLAQTVWENIARSIGTFRDNGEGSFARWHYVVAQNTVTDEQRSWIRRSKRVTLHLTAEMLELDHPAEGLTVEELVERQEVARDVQRALAKLNAEQRRCLVLRIWQGMSVAETAQVMGKNANAIKQLQLRATRALQRRLEPLPASAVTRRPTETYTVDVPPLLPPSPRSPSKLEDGASDDPARP